MRWIPAILSTLALAPALAAEPPVQRSLENLSRGLRFEIKLTAIAQAPSDPGVIYVGTEHGRVHKSTDGGQSWEESTALTRRGAFYGAIRKQKTDYTHIGWGLEFGYRPARMARLRLLSADLDFRLGGLDPIGRGRINDGSTFHRRISGERAEIQRQRAANSLVTGQFNDLFLPSTLSRRSGGTSGGSDLAVGIKSGAPRLAYQVRRKRNWGIGVNLQQTLALKAAPATGIWFFDVNPRDPDDVLAASADGLLRSRDGGYSWPLVLTGPTPRERAINHLARRPDRPEVIYAGTGRGLQFSSDGGDGWEPVGHPLVITSDVRWVDFDRTRPDVFYVGATWGLLRTKDGGKSFGIAFRSSWPPQSLVRQVQIDPHDPTRIWLATADGLMVSEDDGQSFERAGGLLFVGSNVRCLSPGREPGHMIAVTDTEVWETRDAGKSWQIALFGRVQWKLTYGMFELGRRESMLVLTEAEVLRYGPATRARPITAALVERFNRVVANEPGQSDAVTVALRRAGVYRPDLNDYRHGARWSALLPRVTAAYGWQDLAIDGGRDGYPTNADVVERLRGEVGARWITGWKVWAGWDLAPLVFSRAEAPVARIGRTNRYAEWSVRSTVINLFQERRRLLFEDFVDEGPDARVALMRNLRIEELTAHLNVMTGDLFQPAPALSSPSRSDR